MGISACGGVASGLDAIEISLRALGCGPGDRVLTTPISAFATTLAIVKTGAVPVFVDTDDHGLIDLSGARNCLSEDATSGSSCRFTSTDSRWIQTPCGGFATSTGC